MEAQEWLEQAMADFEKAKIHLQEAKNILTWTKKQLA